MDLIRFENPGYLLLLLAAVPLFLYPFLKKGRNVLLRKLAFALRLTTVVLIVLALSGLQIARGKRNAAIVFVVDQSQSVAPVDKARTLESIRRFQSSLAPEDETGVVVFGREAVIEHQLQRNLRLSEIQSSPEAAGTNISKGLNLARVMLHAKSDFSKRMVLLSDGNQTAGDALREAAMCAWEGVAVDVMPLATAAESSGRKLFLQECSGPESIRLGEPFEIRLSLRGRAGTDVVLHRYHNGDLISKQRHKLAGDQEVFRIPERISTPGFHQYQIRVQDADPNRPDENDEAGIVIYAYGRTRVLHIVEAGADYLDRILRSQGFEVRRSIPQSAPKIPLEFAPYDAVILNNVPASAFTEDQLRALTEHVERYAGGLIMTGGSGSFGPGGYSGSTIEKALPVEMALRNREKKPALALVLVLDKSGSMGMEQRKISKMDMAKESVLQFSDLLTAQDTLGIIAFDRSPREVMPLGGSVDRNLIQTALRAIAAGGGTSMLPAVEMAYTWLNSSTAEKKHILLLSDGQADQAERKPLIERVSGSAAVFSTVGVGGDVDRALLQKLADSGHGRAYFTDTGMELPEIFKREGLLISGKWFVERPFKPHPVSDHEMLQNLGKEGMPQMMGYVATTPKNLSETLLAADNEDPILACWRYGLGKTVVFTSDLSSPWTRQLVNWESFPRMWAHMVRWSSRGMQSESMHANVSAEDEDAVLTVNSFDAEGNFGNFMSVRARLEYPDSAGKSLELAQTASGKYASRFPLQGRGMYLFSIAAKSGDTGREEVLHFGFDFSKLPEDRKLFSDQVFIHSLAETAGGLVLNRASDLRLSSRASGYRDAWPLAAIIAIFLFLIDLGIRRLANHAK